MHACVAPLDVQSSVNLTPFLCSMNSLWESQVHDAHHFLGICPCPCPFHFRPQLCIFLLKLALPLSFNAFFIGNYSLPHQVQFDARVPLARIIVVYFSTNCQHETHSSTLAGFPDHPHRGFETVTYMLKGQIKHEDFAGHSGVIGAIFSYPTVCLSTNSNLRPWRFAMDDSWPWYCSL